MQRLFWLSGAPVEWIFVLLDSIPEGLSSREFEKATEMGLRAFGYEVKHNFIVPNRGDGYRGKVDFVARREMEIVAIELDRVKPRQKSITKLKQVPNATTRVVYCRQAIQVPETGL